MDRKRSTVYRDVFGGWRWEASDTGGEFVDSRHGYATREECLQDCKAHGFEMKGARSRSVLCVEPDLECRQQLQKAFAADHVVFAVNAYEALRNLHVRVFDLYILEYWLPDLAGVQLCREIRKLDPRAPIIFCTATTREDARGKALKAGAEGFFRKPVEPGLLQQRTCVLLEQADLASLAAKRDEERAIEEELVRRASVAVAQTEHARELAATATERTARVKAYRTFIESGGTRANFERWWPQLLSSAWANHQLDKGRR